MDARRSAKTSRTTQRPELGDRVHSAPTPTRRRQSNARRPSDTIKVSGVIDRSSKASIRDDPFFRSYDSPQSVRLAEQSRKAAAGTSGPEDVRIYFLERGACRVFRFPSIAITAVLPSLTAYGTVNPR